MADEFRKLSEAGMQRFSDWLSAGAKEQTPTSLLHDADTSEPLATAIAPEQRLFANRYEFGSYLGQLLKDFNTPAISGDRGLWSALALFWFDQICPIEAGERKPDKSYRYILSGDYRHYYRHLVRSPWQLVREHGESSRFLLLATSEDKSPLRRHGDILEQLGGTQALIRSRPIITTAAQLYGNPETGRPRRSAAGKGGGTVRRFARVLRQLDLTFDAELLSPAGLIELLPQEFELWKKSATGTRMSASVSRTAQNISPQS